MRLAVLLAALMPGCAVAQTVAGGAPSSSVATGSGQPSSPGTVLGQIYVDRATSGTTGMWTWDGTSWNQIGGLSAPTLSKITPGSGSGGGAQTYADDIVNATYSTGSAVTTGNIDVTTTSGLLTPLSTTAPGNAAAVLYNWTPSTQLTHTAAAWAKIKAGTATAPLLIAMEGDSTTRGFGSAATGWTATGFPSEMARILSAGGIAAQADGFLASGFSPSNGYHEDLRETLIAGAAGSSAQDAGGSLIQFQSTGDGVDFVLDNPRTYNRVTVSYLDQGSGSFTVAVDGGSPIQTVTLTGTNNTLTQTVTVPSGSHQAINIRNASGAYFFQGAYFWNSAAPGIVIANAAMDGQTATNADQSFIAGQLQSNGTYGYGMTAGTAALKPTLTLVDLGINDFVAANETPATAATAIEGVLTTLQSVGSDVVIVIPWNWVGASDTSNLPTLVSDLESWATTNNVGVIDLSATYGSAAQIDAAYLNADTIHFNATGYADVANALTTVLKTAVFH